MIARTVLGKILVFSVFFVGIATGAILDTAYRTRVSSASNNDQRRGDEPHLSPDERAKRDRERLAQYLGLDQTQQEQVAKIQQETGNAFKVLRDKKDPELKALRDKVDPEFKALDAKFDPQFKAIWDEGRAKIHAVLNPEQQKKMDEFWAKRGNRGQGRPPRPGEHQEPGDRSDKSDRPNSNK